MINPIPFCPSFDPWKKLTPVQVSTMSARMGNGGGSSFFGASYSSGNLISDFERRINRPAIVNPSSGEISRAFNTLFACSQSTPDVPVCGLRSWFARPTPMMEPTSVCELDAGNPNHHVPKFQSMAAISSAKTIANPAPELTCRINSTGSRVMTANATVPVESHTPARLHIPDHTTAMFGSSECV